MRVILIVLDSFGIGALPDAVEYNDNECDTFGHIYAKTKLELHNLASLGLFNIDNITPKTKVKSPIGIFGKAIEKSFGKDTIIGHWEIMGLITDKPLPLYTNGFPDDIIRKLEFAWNKNIIGNVSASGTQIINELGEKHVNTGYPIIYTSADSVLQIAAHEEVIPLTELYQMCETARKIMIGKNAVGRIIARPFVGEKGNYQRTSNRRDYSMKPSRTLLNDLLDAGYTIIGVGKIYDIFSGIGITNSIKTHNNDEGIARTIELINTNFEGLLFVNLVDFDMLYGHRNDVLGYANALNEFDKSLKIIIDSIQDDDLLIITADHGCDPSTAGTDHSREYIPILAYSKSIISKNIGIRSSFSDIAATIAEYFNIDYKLSGVSFLTKEDFRYVRKS